MFIHKFETRRKLKQRIAHLEGELRRAQIWSELKKDANLEECNYLICQACIHGVWWAPDGFYQERLIGCSKTVSCKDFVNK